MVPNQSIIRAFKIIEYLAYHKEKEELSLNDISKATSLNTSTVYRFLENLRQIGIVEKNDKNKQYRLTLELYKLGSSIIDKRNGNLINYAIQSIKLLANQYREIINLYAFEKNQIICIYRMDNFNSTVSYSIKIGSQHPAYCTASGKIFLSNMDEEEITSYFSKIKLHKYTKNTKTNINEIKDELILVKNDGYALDKEEYIDGANCIAVPIITRKNNIHYSISMVLPRSRSNSHDFSQLMYDLKKTANTISNNTSLT